tara:strand:+ start:2717 stop:2905 length:189 start_codon:yes stop_codon:yes gene_type:complete
MSSAITSKIFGLASSLLLSSHEIRKKTNDSMKMKNFGKIILKKIEVSFGFIVLKTVGAIMLV